MVNEYTKLYDDLDTWLQAGKVHHKVSVIVTLCAQCGAFIGVKDGEGECGINHSLCTHCVKKHREAISKFKEVNCHG